MNVESRIMELSKNATAFWLDATKRWLAARDKINSNLPYTSDQLATDMAAFWIKASDFWLGLVPSTGDPVLPSAIFSLPGGIASTQKALVSLGEVITKGVPLKSTDVVGSSGSIPAGDVTLSGDGTATLEVTIKFPNSLKAGFCQGLVTAGTEVIAVIVVNVF
jgi:hypothetical protein